MFRKLLLVGIAVLFDSGGLVQLAYGLLASFLTFGACKRSMTALERCQSLHIRPLLTEPLLTVSRPSRASCQTRCSRLTKIHTTTFLPSFASCYSSSHSSPPSYSSK